MLKSEVKLPIWLPTIKSGESFWCQNRKLNCQFDSRPLKVGSRFEFLAWRWHATYRWKTFDKGYNFASNLTSIRGLHIKLWASKIAGVPILGISNSSLGSPMTKWHLGVGPIARHIEYYKGEGGGFPQVQVVMSLISSWLPMARPCTKGVPTTH